MNKELVYRTLDYSIWAIKTPNYIDFIEDHNHLGVRAYKNSNEKVSLEITNGFYSTEILQRVISYAKNALN